MTYSIIQKSQLEGAHRLDAEYYQPKYLRIRQILRQSPTLSSLFIGVIRNPMAYGFDYMPVGIPFYRIDDLLDPFLNDVPVFISETTNQRLKKTALKYGDLIMAVRGATIGRLGLFLQKVPANISPNVIILRPKDTSWSKYYALVLLSKFGKSQIEWMIAGTGQPTITTDRLAEIRIPQNKKIKRVIDNIFDEATGLFELSRSLYFQAENLLLEKLGLKDFKPEDELSYIVNSSDLEFAHRADAEYFQPKYEKLISKIKMKNAKLLPEVIQNVPAIFNPLIQPEKTFQYVELANINQSIGIIDGFTRVLGKEAPSRAKRVLKAGDVIVSSVEGSLEKVALVNKEQEGYLASTGFFQFRSKKILPEVLLVIAKSLILQMQLEKQTAGTILTAVPKERLKDIIVPILPKSNQQKIADLVKKSHQARKKSKDLLEKAKRKVEEVIEKGGG